MNELNFSFSRTNFVNDTSYNERTHAIAWADGIPNFVVDGLEYDETAGTLSSGRGINGGLPFEIGVAGETVAISGTYRYIYVKSTLDGENSLTTVLETDEEQTGNNATKFFMLYDLESENDYRFTSYVKYLEFEAVGDDQFILNINGTKSPPFNSSAVATSYSKSEQNEMFLHKSGEVSETADGDKVWDGTQTWNADVQVEAILSVEGQLGLNDGAEMYSNTGTIQATSAIDTTARFIARASEGFRGYRNVTTTDAVLRQYSTAEYQTIALSLNGSGNDVLYNAAYDSTGGVTCGTRDTQAGGLYSYGKGASVTFKVEALETQIDQQEQIDLLSAQMQTLASGGILPSALTKEAESAKLVSLRAELEETKYIDELIKLETDIEAIEEVQGRIPQEIEEHRATISLLEQAHANVNSFKQATPLKTAMDKRTKTIELLQEHDERIALTLEERKAQILDLKERYGKN